MKNFHLKAFSLVELMISLIVISLIAAAFTPVITKKLSSSTVKIGKSISSVRSDCEKFEENGGKCNACFDSFCLLCDIFCTQNQYKNVGECKCENCSERSEGCLKCSSKGCDTCKAGYYVDSSGNCVKCPKGAKCDGVNKEICPAGYYQDNDGQNSCKSCLTNNGQYSAKEGSTACSSCGAGTYAGDKDGQYDNKNGVSCITCPVGYYCADGKNPKICDNDTYQNEEGKTSCKNCATGTYSPSNNANIACSSCDSRCTSCSTSSTNCSNCISGYYLNYNTCTLCPTNATCDGSSNWACDSGYTAENNECVEETPTFTYTGAYTQDDEVAQSNNQIVVYLNSSGTFTANFTKTVKLRIIGGGGGAGSGSSDSSICKRNYGYGGCGGNIQSTSFNIVKGTNYSVTIGGGGSGKSGCWNTTTCADGDSGNSSKFANISANGGAGGYQCKHEYSQSCSQSSVKYYGKSYSVKGGGNANNTGNGGKDTTGTGQNGASGVVIMVITK